MQDIPTLVIGSYLSPFVRKVLVCLHCKQIPYVIDPFVPFYGNEDFSRLSPLRRIPVLVDDQVTIADSTVICEYLEDRYPNQPLLPSTASDRARARWLEEFADTRMAEVLIWHYFNQYVIRRHVWNETPDQEIVQNAVQDEIPGILAYLEQQVPQSGFMFGNLSIADIALCSPFRNAAFAGYRIDPVKWPVAAAYIERTLSHDAFLQLRKFEDMCMKTPIARHRDALETLGAPLSRSSYGDPTPRRGILGIP